MLVKQLTPLPSLTVELGSVQSSALGSEGSLFRVCLSRGPNASRVSWGFQMVIGQN